jgi:hypothetical protein
MMKSREYKAAEADRKSFKVSAGIDWLDLKSAYPNGPSIATFRKNYLKSPVKTLG